MNWKQHIPLIVGLAIPVVMVVAVAISVYLPRTTLNSTYNFLYVTGNYPYYIENAENNTLVEHTYSVEGGKLVDKTHVLSESEQRYRDPYNEAPKFYVYDAKNDVSREVSVEDVQKYHIDSNVKSPEGYEVVHGTNDGFPFFFGGADNYRKIFLKGNKTSKQINVQLSSDVYRYDFQFIGWINPS